MNPGCYLLFPDHKPPRLAAVTKIGSFEVEYEWFEQGCRKRGILTKYSPDSSADLGVHEGKRVFGIINEATSLQKLQSALAEFVKDLNAKKEAARALDREREAKEEAKKEVERALERDRMVRIQAKMEAERALAMERRAREEAESKRQREERAELDRIEAAERERLRRLQYHFEELDRKFDEDFLGAHTYWHEHLSSSIKISDFEERRKLFVRRWFARHPDLGLDDEQAEAVAEYGHHIQVTARAGSGKTRTLVARALFQISHCRIPASSILILAFNKKAVEEIRERLMVHLIEEEMPHVLTFHALAYRIVRPDEKLIFDAGDSKEGQVFSSTIQRIIDSELQGGTLEREIRSLMEDRWTMDLNECWHTNLEKIVAGGYDLKKDELLDFRINLPSLTMDGRRMDSEVHKQIGNTLLRHRFRYRYGKTIHRYAGATYAPDFSQFDKDRERFIIIEVPEDGKTVTNPAREAFWKSERGERALLLEGPSEITADKDAISRYLVEGLLSLGVEIEPMSDDELWEVLKDRAIDQFTKAVKQFIARCQKELISPIQLGDFISRNVRTSHRIQSKFWLLGRQIFNRYLTVLSEERKTDFDQLMLNAAGMIQAGHVRFTSSRGDGRIDRIKQVLIDEYQDFSHLFDELRKAFIRQSTDALFFCVGDDWQAINKFAGSDLGYFTNFGDTFSPSVQKVISRNYRSCWKIVEAGNLVMAGHGPPSLPHRDTPGEVHIVHVEDTKGLSEIEEMVAEELGDIAVPILRLAAEFTSQGQEVAILSRNSSMGSSEGVLRLEAWERKLREFLPESQRELLKVSTTHGYKGRESDVVIMVRPEYYPSIHPDAVFNKIFGDTLESNVADEKRLFYVGVTRARTKLFLLHDKPPENPFRRVPGTFLRLVPNKTSYDINRITARLVCGERIVIRLSNKPGCAHDSGTYPLKDQLKRDGYKWSDENKAWSRFLDPGSISSPFECTQYLLQQLWFRDADGIVATFAWEDQQHRMRIDRGTVVPDGSSPPLQDGPMSIGGQREPSSGGKGRTTASASQSSSVVRPTASRPRDAAPVTLPTNQNRIDRPAKSSGAATGVFETSVAGMRYEGRMEKASHLAVGDFVRLQREPGNTHDRNAIQVVTPEGVRIGYVSRHVAAHLAKGLDAWGGTWQAKVGSVWKQPTPHFLVSIQICFPLPPGVVIPEELDAAGNLEDSPFGNSGPSPRPAATTPLTTAEDLKLERDSIESREDVPDASPDSLIPEKFSPDNPLPPRSGALTEAQEVALEDLLDPSLGPLIKDLYLSGCCPWPYIGYEGLDSQGRCTDSTVEVAWPDFKVGIALPANEVSRFHATGWKVLPAATVTASAIQRLFATATEAALSPEIESARQNDMPASPSNVSPSIGDFPTTDRSFQHGPFIDDEPDDDIPF